jgi:hypothetical protein
MRPRLTLILILSCFGALFLTCYALALFQDHQFAYRDSSEYYYWLNKRVQAAWDEGRWPLWEPEENAGMPLLGNPTAAVLYPGKVVFAILPYAWGARAYILGHSALAFLSMLILMRSWGTSAIGSTLSAMAYAFGGPILFQYSNIIYLIGAAWLPLGLHAVDRWARLGRRWGLVELAIVLSMQVLGGEPQAAYLLGVASVGYAAGLAWNRARSRKTDLTDSRSRRLLHGLSAPLAIVALILWCIGSLVLARWLPKLREPGNPPPPFRWMPWVPWGVMLAWGLLAAGLLCRWRRRVWRQPLGVMWLGLAGAAILATALSAAQLLPVIEFTQRTGRSHGRTDEVYEISVSPVRLLELAWPNFLGTPFGTNDYWGDLITTPGRQPTAWVPTHYLGGLTLALALSSLAIRRGPAWRVWLTVIGSLGLLGSLGWYTSPIWMARALAEATGPAAVRNWLPDIGPPDPIDVNAVRRDGYLRDSDASVYWWMATVLPGFQQFRYPAKLFTLTALAAAALAGLGWDRLIAGRARGTALAFSGLLVLTLVSLALVLLWKESILAVFRSATVLSAFGPFDSVAAYRAVIRNLGQAAIVFGLGLLITVVARKRPHLAGAMALIVMTTDLAAANSRYILTVPQSMFDTKPEVVRVIEEAERADRSPGPFRIHRVRGWHVRNWSESRSPYRSFEMSRWDHDTLNPKHGIAYGQEYVRTIGVGELADYEPFFASFYLRVPDDRAAATLGVEVGTPVVYFPRRAYDLWNTRYFIIPFDSEGWRDPTRASAPFLFQTLQIFPDPAGFIGPGGAEQARKWTETRDYRVLRNLEQYPRAWIVHDARETSRVTESLRGRRGKTLQEILYAPDPVWHDASQPVYDPRSLAWVTPDDMTAIGPYLSGQTPGASETVKVTYPRPEEAVLEASLDSPGLVVLADINYPGWELTIDGEPAAVYRVNGIMRGAAVPAGRHRLVYTYMPQSFKIGRLVSLAGLIALLLLCLACARWPSVAILGGRDESDGGSPLLA